MVFRLLGLPISFATAADRVDDRGVFTLIVNGQEIGTEKFEIRSSRGHIEAKAEIQVRTNQNGHPVQVTSFPNLVLDAEFRPLTYYWSQKGPQSSWLEADFRSSPVRAKYRTVTGQEDSREFNLPKDVLVVDATSVIHHYELLARRFRISGSRKQTFRAFIPQEAWPTDLTVEDRGPESVLVHGRNETLNHLVVITERAGIDLWVDGSGRLERVSNRAEQFEAVRKR